MEQKFLTKKQINAIHKRVGNEFYEKDRRYSEQDVKEIFDGTNYPVEIVNKEISRELENDKYYGKKKKVKKSKIKKLKTKSLESSVMGEDLGKVGRGLGKVFRFITYPTLLLPSMGRAIVESENYDGDKSLVVGTFVCVSLVSLGVYSSLSNNPELIPYVAGAQLATNIGSGIYEYIRSVKKRVKEKK